MPMSEAAMAGIRDNGRGWRHQIRGLKPLTDQLARFNDQGGPEDPGDAAKLDGVLKAIAQKVRTFAENKDGLEIDYQLEDALEWLEDSFAVEHLAETQDPEVYMEEANYQLNQVWDWADYNRVLMS